MGPQSCLPLDLPLLLLHNWPDALWIFPLSESRGCHLWRVSSQPSMTQTIREALGLPSPRTCFWG